MVSAMPEAHASAAALANLEERLSGQESAVADLIPGAEKSVDWFDGRRERLPLAIVYVHGFSATRQETHPLAREVGAAIGAHVFYTRLTGHGQDGAALGAATVEDWLSDAREAMAIGQLLGERTVVIACSTGATLVSAWLMEHPEAAEQVYAMAFISPNFGLMNRSVSILNLPFGRQLASLIAGGELSFEPINAAHARYWTNSYPVDAVATMMQLLRRARRGDPARLPMPVLTVYSPGDQVVDPAATERMHARLPSSRKRRLLVEDSADPSQHVIAGDILSPNTTSRLAGEIARYVLSLGSPPASVDAAIEVSSADAAAR
jgi:alpha-beta hydrolase superfamily lysophospholipase